MTQENEHDIESMKEALSKANNEAASFRHQLNEAKAELEQAHSSANEYKSSYVDAKITAKLAESGVSNVKVAKLLDRSKIDIDESGDLVGFDDQLEQVKTDFAELFQVQKVPSIDAAEKPVAKRNLSSAEKLIQNTR
ncbi:MULTISPECIES: phage scaffolding protein [Rhodococcus]|uniref:Phage scaffolding protein n=1 Tax=Rhodococcus qingshengii JCM 15477 TaxID=1303681 RepID=A0AB38R6R7_RHOSG|nr:MULTISPECIES: phage scaffolding protein [Rhodococcus]UPU40626.1 phage scaffolding protein [Rhodococcus qingshengii JCM 15477]